MTACDFRHVLCQSVTVPKLFLDLTPLREIPAYRRIFAAVSISNIGQQMTAVAVAIQVYDITKSSFSVGLVGLAQLIPLVALGLFGGAMSDSYDRRMIGFVSAVGMAGSSVLLFAQVLLDNEQVWPLYLFVAMSSGFYAVGNPARQAIIPRIVPMEHLQAANSLSFLTWNIGFTIGPLLGGVLIAVTGNVGVAYAIDAIAFTVMMWAMWTLPKLPPMAGAPLKPNLSSVKDGLVFLKGKRNIQMTFYVDLVAMIFGMPRALFPAIALLWYSDSAVSTAAIVGLLTAAPAFGAALSAIFSGPLQRVYKQGTAIIWSIVGWGSAITAFGLTRNLYLALFFLAIAGAADNISAIFRTTMLQVVVPDDYRGRLQGLFTVVVAGGPRLGDFESGTVAAIGGEQLSVVSGGVACIACTYALVKWHKPFMKYDSRDPVA
jgi:MFS family permease